MLNILKLIKTLSDMKKRIIFFCVALSTLSFMAFAWVSWSQIDKEDNIDFFYNVDSRYGTSITKENLQKAKSIVDIVPKERNWGSFPIHTVKVTIFHDNTEISEIGYDPVLNEAQLQLLHSIDYSDSFSLTASCKGKHKNVDKEEYDLFDILTVTPEKEAEYSEGKDALLAFLKENSNEQTIRVKQDQLERGNISFTISKNGKITNIQLSSTSGYTNVDEVMVELVSNLPGIWIPATDSKGEKVDQEFVFSFGRGGC
jgi:hypothetical protein